MGKLYYFGIGGTGSRVLKSLLVLLSAGVKLNATEVVPIIIDPDKGAADLQRTSDLIREYQQLNRHASNIPAQKADQHEARFFATPVHPRKSGLVLPLANQSNKRFEDAVGYRAMNRTQKAVVQMLFSPDVRDMSMQVGFKGNPNMGSIVLNQFDSCKEFQDFLNDFQEGDRIFIVGSIFGGTGASGFPLLTKTLRHLDQLSGAVPNSATIKESIIGATTVLPYFAVQKDEESAIDSSSFYSKATAALSYYEENLKELDSLYYIGDTCTSVLPNVEGGAQQKNPAHFIELAAALAIYDFMDTHDSEWEGGNRYYKEYGLKDHVSDGQRLDFRSLCDRDRHRIAPQLTQFVLFLNYLRDHLQHAEKQPWHVQVGDVFHSSFMQSHLNKVMEMTYAWLNEVQGTGNQRSFAPYALSANADQPFSIVVGYPEKRGLFFSKKDYVLFNDKLNGAIKSSKSPSAESKVLEIFYKATQEIVSDKFKFFRIYDDPNRPSSIQGWGTTGVYNSQDISKIKDPNGDTPNRDITSIPTPWARLDLVKLAFREVVRQGLDGDTIYHRMVSDALDVAEIFFNINKLRDQFEILEWDVKEGLKELKASPNIGVQLMGKGLSVYYEADKEKYNFQDAGHLYLLNYIGKEHRESPCIVGATSPATLFFTPAGRLDFVTPHVSFGEDRPFDKDFCPLYKRADENFIRFWFAYRAMYNASGASLSFAEAFPEVDKYLDETSKCLSNHELRLELQDDEKLCAAFSENAPIYVSSDSTSQQVEILGISLYAAPKLDVTSQSDFVIDATRKDIKGQLPLVLPCEGTNGSNYKKMRYTTANWNSDCKALESVGIPLEQRTLPNDGTPYPYLTLGDFLSDTLLVNDGEGNDKKYFFAGQKGDFSALLPIKSIWFDYFDVDDLKDNLTMTWKKTNNDSYLSVTLKVPIQCKVKGVHHYVEFSKQYLAEDLVTARFTVGVYPYVKMTKGDADYRLVAFNTSQDGIGVVKLDAFNQVHPNVPIEMEVEQPNTGENQRARTTNPLQISLYGAKERIDYIKVSYQGASGMLIPNWMQHEGHKKHLFAVDFGTSNTHIEGREVDARNFSSDELLSSTRFVFSHETDLDYPFPKRLVKQQLFPFAQDEDKSAIQLPTRTVLAYRNNKDEKSWKNDIVIPMLSGNIPFAYQSEELLEYQNVVYNLKWDSSSENENQLRCYIGNLLLMIRNKVLQNQGNLSETEIRWFYPLSMSRSKVRDLREIWSTLYKEYFGGDEDKVKSMCESLAPLGYYLRHEGTTEQTCLLDIGGGTTDMAFANEGQVQCISSMRYAAGSLWGLDFNTDVQSNGFVQRYKERIAEGLEQYPELAKVNERLLNRDNAPELLDFWLSLAKSTQKKDGTPSIDFARFIKEDAEMKAILLLFYAALLYHIAAIVNKQKLSLPRHIGFSGNGSRMLRILGAGGKSEELTEFTRKFLEMLTGQEAHPKFKLIFVEKPKELTCKGGLDYKNMDETINLQEHKIILRGDVQGGGNKTEAVLVGENDALKDIDMSVLNGIKAEVDHFLRALDGVESRIAGGYPEIFGISKGVFGRERSELLIDVVKYTNDALLRRKAESGEENAKVEESLFFYPIVGMIHEWARKVAGL